MLGTYWRPTGLGRSLLELSMARLSCWWIKNRLFVVVYQKDNGVLVEIQISNCGVLA